MMFISRLTLLLGPPSSGKTTLLLALAGRLKSDLQVLSYLNFHDLEVEKEHVLLDSNLLLLFFLNILLKC